MTQGNNFESQLILRRVQVDDAIAASTLFRKYIVSSSRVCSANARDAPVVYRRQATGLEYKTTHSESFASNAVPTKHE